MRKLHFIVKFIVAFIVATFAVALCIRFDASDNVVICAYFGVAIMTMLVLGAFDEPARKERGNFGSIRHRMGKGRSYGQAAIFVGAACVFIGSPEQCDEMCQDLWHHAQEAEVRMLDGSEKLEVL